MDANLNEIATSWTVIRAAAAGPPEAAQAALETLLVRYDRAIRQYLLGALHDPDAADEVYQDFACRLLNGAFRKADPSRGRFRDLLRTSLIRMVTDHHRDRQRTAAANLPDQPIADPRHPELDTEKQFLEIWLCDLMQRAWDGLATVEARTEQPLHTVLRIRIEQPNLDSAGLAEAIERQTGQPVDVPRVRKLLHTARQRFIRDFVREVELTLDDPTDDDLEEELQSLGMLERCRDHLRKRRDHRRPSSPPPA